MSQSFQMTVSATPQLVGRVTEGSMSIFVHAGGTMYFGGSNTVSATTGFRLDKDDKYSTIIPEGNEVWVMTDVDGPTLYVFATTI